ncbi:MAG: hypothetical protein SGJ21_06775 [Alphaproteobacteria bacterium]|nr:hypothetical protein [Alphaproteobacteria bacterium]
MSEREQDFFIGWAETPKPDRRFLLGASLGLLTLSGVGAALLARSQAPVGTGSWDMSDVRTFSGMLVREPYPMLLTNAFSDAPRTAFLVTNGKTGVQRRLGALADGPVNVMGSVIQRGASAMIAAIDGDAWIAPAPSVAVPEFATWAEEDLGEVLLVGEVLDAKCWFGAMRPSSGKVHKACAALCVRGGLPPAFCSGGTICGESSEAPLLLRADGGPHGEELLELVADPVHAIGRLVRVGDVTQFRADISAIHRL